VTKAVRRHHVRHPQIEQALIGRRLLLAQIGGPQSLAGEQVAELLLRDLDLNPSVFQSRPRVHQMSQNLCGRRQLANSARRTSSCWRREVAFVLIRPVHRSIDGGLLSGLACRSPGSARSIRKEAANVRCDSGSWAGRRPGLGGYVTGPGATRGVPAAGGR